MFAEVIIKYNGFAKTRLDSVAMLLLLSRGDVYQRWQVAGQVSSVFCHCSEEEIANTLLLPSQKQD